MPLTYKQLSRILADFEYQLVAQRGSHQKFRHGSMSVEVPKHPELKPGTAKSILGDIATQQGLDVRDLIKQYHIKL